MDKMEMNSRNRGIFAKPTPEAKQNPYPPILLSPYTEKGGAKPFLSPLSEFGDRRESLWEEGVGGGVKKASAPPRNQPLSAPSAGLAFRLAGGFNPWRRWYTPLISMLFVLLTVHVGIADAEKPERSQVEILLSGKTELAAPFLEVLESNLNKANIDLVIHTPNSQEFYKVSFSSVDLPSSNLNLMAYDFGLGSMLALTVESPKSLEMSPILFARLEIFPTIQDLSLDVNSSEFGITSSLVTALSFYSVEKCDLAMPYFEETARKLEEYVNSGEGNEQNFGILDAFYRSRYMNFFWGTCELLDENYLKAIELFHVSKEDHDPYYAMPEPRINLAWSYLQLGMIDDAFLYSEIYGARDDARVICLTRRAQLYALISDYNSALEELNTSIEIASNIPADSFYALSNSDTAQLYLLRGQMYLALYEWDKALADYNAALELALDYADAYYYRGVLYASILQTGLATRDDALADFQHYLELAPDGDHAEEAAQAIADLEAANEALNE